MDNLNNIPNVGNWGDAASKLNDNFNKVKQAVTTVENTTKNNKGYFTSLSALNTAFPSPKAGQTAYVYNEASSTKYYIYNAVNGAWVASSIGAPSVGVDLAEYAKKSEVDNITISEDGTVKKDGVKVSVKGDNFSIIETKGFIPNINTSTGTLDLGEDPVVMVNGESYVLKNIHSDKSKYREIDLSQKGASTAEAIYFNIETAEFSTHIYTEKLAANFILIGANRIYGKPFSQIQLMFRFRIDGVLTRNYLDGNVLLIPTKDYTPYLDIDNNILYLGDDPVLFIGNEYYILKILNRDNPEKHREINLTKPGASDKEAFYLVFNVIEYNFTLRYFRDDISYNEVIIGVFRFSGNLQSSQKILQYHLPFEVRTSLNEIKIYPKSTISLITSKIGTPDLTPVVNLETVTLDLGPDPIIVVGGNSYALVHIHGADSPKFRSIPLINEQDTTTAHRLYFNIDTKEFEVFGWQAAHDIKINTRKELYLVGGIRLSATTIAGQSKKPIIVNLPFKFRYDYEVDGIESGGVGFTPLRPDHSNASVLMMAHRGTHRGGIAPENSLDAFRLAARAGYDMLETDFYPTKDDELVIMHDTTINRTMRMASDYSAIPEPVTPISKTLAELKESYVFASDNVGMRKPIPTLREYFEVCRETGIHPIPEFKASALTNDHVKQAYDIGCEVMGKDNFSFISFSYPHLDFARTLSENLQLFYIGSSLIGTTNSITGDTREKPNNIWYPNHSSFNREQVNKYHRKNMKVATWTVPNANFDSVFKKGASVICTDTCGPNISRNTGNWLYSNGVWDGFVTNGTIADGQVSLGVGNTIVFGETESEYLGAYYIKVSYRGSIKIVAPNLNTTVTSITDDTVVFQVLVNNQGGEVTITGMSEDTFVQIVEYSFAAL